MEPQVLASITSPHARACEAAVPPHAPARTHHWDTGSSHVINTAVRATEVEGCLCVTVHMVVLRALECIAWILGDITSARYLAENIVAKAGMSRVR